jgi:amino-acid N-acetyltransferase
MTSMELTYKLIDDTESFQAFRALLKTSGLPADDLDFKRDLLVGYYEGEALVGTGGLEIHGSYALLRSLSVKMGIRGKLVGSAITEYLLNEGRKNKLKAIYLLTETAQGFFEKKGFVGVPRDEVPAEVRSSSEFTHVCPTTAVAMRLVLT